MLTLFIQAYLISFITSFIISYSGVMNSIKKFIWKRFNKTPYQYFQMKPFDCELCMSFWITLIVSLFDTNILYSLTIASISGFLAPLNTILLNFIYKVINNTLNK